MTETDNIYTNDLEVVKNFREHRSEFDGNTPKEVLQNASKQEHNSIEFLNDQKKVAYKRLKNLLERNRVYYVTSDNFLLREDSYNSFVSIPSIRYFIQPEQEQSNVTYCDLITIIQQKKTHINNKYNKAESGYFKIPLRAFVNGISHSKSQKTIVAFYIAEEDRFYFKRASTIMNYAKSIASRKKRSKDYYQLDAIPATVWMRVNLNEKSEYDDGTERRPNLDFDGLPPLAKKYSNPNKSHHCSLCNGIITTDFPAVVKEEEIPAYFKQINRYDSNFRLRFKTISRFFK